MCGAAGCAHLCIFEFDLNLFQVSQTERHLFLAGRLRNVVGDTSLFWGRFHERTLSLMNDSDPKEAEDTLPPLHYAARRESGEWRVEEAAAELVEVVDSTTSRLARLDSSATAASPASGKWSVKEIIGHLIDSAVNNHQRFVRGQYEDPLVLPGYAQDFWVRAQGYADAPWPELAEFWRLYNHHLAGVIRRIPPDKLEVECRIGPNTAEPLGFIVEDYVAHLKHHVLQIEQLISIV